VTPPASAFTDQRERLRRTVRNALDGAAYQTSRSEESGRMLVVEARRPDGRLVGVRFRGVRDSKSTEEPVAGATLRLRAVDSPGSLIGLLVPPLLRGPSSSYVRVRIEAGTARLDIVCQDAEWWEDEAAPHQTPGSEA
jgi:hypothetical protein